MQGNNSIRSVIQNVLRWNPHKILIVNIAFEVIDWFPREVIQFDAVLV